MGIKYCWTENQNGRLSGLLLRDDNQREYFGVLVPISPQNFLITVAPVIKLDEIKTLGIKPASSPIIALGAPYEIPTDVKEHFKKMYAAVGVSGIFIFNQETAYVSD